MGENEIITERQLRALLDAQTALRKRAEEVARQAREALEKVAEALCPDAVDRFRQANPAGLAVLAPDELARLVISEVGARMRRLEVAGAAGQDLARALEEAKRQAERSREEVTRLRRELEAERAARQAAETRAAALERMAERISAPAPLPVPPSLAEETSDGEGARGAGLLPLATPLERLPAWVQEWAKAPSFERDLLALWVLGSTGVARRMDASVLVGQAFGVEPGSGSVARSFDRLKKLGILEVVEGRPDQGRAVWHLFRLSEKGADAFRLLFGQDPAPSQTTLLLNRHKSPEHVLLILAVADLFAAAGWKADPLPDPVLLPSGERYEPDIVAVGPETLFVECERATDKNFPERSGKWRRYYEATLGNLVIAVPDQKSLEPIRSEVLFFLSAMGVRKYRLRMMVLETATPQDLFQFVREQE